MKLGKAMEVLGLVGTALAELTDDDVRRAFRSQMKLYHPDTTTDAMDPARHPQPQIVWTADSLKEARDALLNRRNVDDFSCKQCRGKGMVPARMGSKPCGACKGTGNANGC